MTLAAPQIAAFARDGFLAIEHCFTPAEVELLKTEAYLECSSDHPGRVLEKSGAVRTVFASHKRNETFGRLSRVRKMAGAAAELLSSEVYVHQFKINAKLGLAGDQWEWHQDYLYWKKEDAMPTPAVLSAVVFLNDVNQFNGPLLVIPGSHLLGAIELAPEEKFASLAAADAWKPTLTADLKYKLSKEKLAAILETREIKAITGQAGLVLYFHGNLLHASAGNLTPVDRLSVFVSYNSVANPLGAMDSPRPAFIAERDFTPVTTIPNNALLPSPTGAPPDGSHDTSSSTGLPQAPRRVRRMRRSGVAAIL